MKQFFSGLFFAFLLVSGNFMFSGCVKNGTTRTVDAYMTASIGTTTFSAADVSAATVNPQAVDTGTTIVIKGYLPNNNQEIILTISKYNQSEQGTYSIVQGQATAQYIHGTTSVASGGVVAISKITSNSISGYFSFNTFDGYNVLSGTYCVAKPY